MKRTNSSINQEKEKLRSHLEKAKLRLTKGREAVFNKIISSHGHFTAEELAKALKSDGQKVSRATVYRSIKEHLEAGVIRETAFGDKHHHYEHLYDEKQHHHAQCLRCHRFIEFPDLKEDSIYHPYLEKQGFKILGHEMHFYGICKNCQSHENKEF